MSMSNQRADERKDVGMKTQSWTLGVAVACLVGAAALQAKCQVKPQDDKHRVDTVPLSDELESLGGIGGLAVDSEGHVILANFNKYVWRISPEGEVQILADNFSQSSGNTVLRNGDILQSDFEAQSILRMSQADSGVEVFCDEGLHGPVGLVEGPEGDIYVANFSGGYIARVPASGGAATVFSRHNRMTSPNSIVRASSGDFFVADLRSPVLFKISAEGEATEFVTLPGSANGHLTIADGALYVTQLLDQRIVRVEFDGSFRIVAGTGVRGFKDGLEGVATISYPNGIVADPGGLFVYFNNHRGIMRSGERGDILLRRLYIPESTAR
ncbi:MAG: hypothetical protein ACF8GE_11435 [Phycisphaerales bacterium JB043]